MNLPRYGLSDGDADLRAHAAIASQSFAFPPSHGMQWVSLLGKDSFRVLRDGAEVQAGLALYRMGQFFGGRSVPAWGVAGVAVAPHMRGKGLASEMMRHLLHEMADAGVALSPLYSANNALYNSLGWEVAGSRTLYEFRGNALVAPRKSTETLRRFTDADHATVRELYARFASGFSGMLDRNDAIWARVTRQTDDDPLYGVLHAEGYVLYTQHRPPGGTRYDIEVRDMAWLTPEAGRALAGFLAGHSTQVGKISLWGSDDDPLLGMLVGDAFLPIAQRQHWMLRIVDADAALAARGWPAGLDAEFAFTLIDDVLDANAGPRHVRVREGRAEVSRDQGKSGPTLDARGLAALFSGMRSPAELRRTGHMSGTTTQDSTLTTAFTGPSPHTPDFF